MVKGNLFVDCNPSLHIDARALGWAHDHSDEWVQEGREKGTLSGIRYNEPPYSERYPELINILDEEPAAPRGNRVFANVSFGGKWDEVNDDARKYVTIESNLVDRDPHFQSSDHLSDGTSPRPVDFALKPDSPAWQVGFEQLPLEKMGIYQDENRVSWPVMYEVR